MSGELGQDSAYGWSVFEHNTARTGSSPEPDFHGDPHCLDRVGGDAFGSLAGVKITSPDDVAVAGRATATRPVCETRARGFAPRYRLFAAGWRRPTLG